MKWLIHDGWKWLMIHAMVDLDDWFWAWRHGYT